MTVATGEPDICKEVDFANLQGASRQLEAAAWPDDESMLGHDGLFFPPSASLLKHGADVVCVKLVSGFACQLKLRQCIVVVDRRCRFRTAVAGLPRRTDISVQ